MSGKSDPGRTALSHVMTVAERERVYAGGRAGHPDQFHTIIAEAVLPGRSVSYDLSLPRREDASIAVNWLAARLFNLCAIVSPSALRIHLDQPAEALVRRAADALFEPPEGYAAVVAIISRMYGAPLDIMVDSDPYPAALGRQGPVYVPNPGGRRPADIFSRIREVVVGIDFGGTDIKAAAADRSGIVHLQEHTWRVKPREFKQSSNFRMAIETMIRFTLAQVALRRRPGFPELKERFQRLTHDAAASLSDLENGIDRVRRAGIRLPPPDAVGISFPDVIIDDRIVGGRTSKYTALRAKHNTGHSRSSAERAYWVEFDAFLTPLAARISSSLRAEFAYTIPVLITNDGNAGALWAAVESGQRGVLALSLGTSLAGGMTELSGDPFRGMMEVGNLVIYSGDAGYRELKHTSLEIYGCAQQLLSQDAVFRLAVAHALLHSYPTATEARALAHITDDLWNLQPERVHSLFGRIGKNLCLVLDTLQTALPAGCFDTVVLFGRVVRGEPGRIVVEVARQTLATDPSYHDLSHLNLLRATDLAGISPDPHYSINALAQAVGAIYHAVSR